MPKVFDLASNSIGYVSCTDRFSWPSFGALRFSMSEMDQHSAAPWVGEEDVVRVF